MVGNSACTLYSHIWDYSIFKCGWMRLNLELNLRECDCVRGVHCAFEVIVVLTIDVNSVDIQQAALSLFYQRREEIFHFQRLRVVLLLSLHLTCFSLIRRRSVNASKGNKNKIKYGNATVQNYKDRDGRNYVDNSLICYLESILTRH